MAALINVNPTFIDLAKALDPKGNLMPVAEVLNVTNEMDEITWAEGNMPTGHMHRIRTGLPSVTWGQLYKGVQPSKGTSAQVTDACGWMESLSEVDSRMLRLAPDGMAFRQQEDRPHIEVMGQEFMRTLFKGGVADVEKFIGLEARFNTTAAPNGANIIRNATSEDTDLTSIWLIGWSPRTLFCFGPRGFPTGLKQTDWGEDIKTDETGGLYKVYRTHFEWSAGLAVADWRYAVRAQLDLSAVTDDGATGPSLPKIMRSMIERMPADAFSTTRVAFYTSRAIRNKLMLQMEERVKNSTLQLKDVGAVGALSPRYKPMFDMIPVNRVDALSVDETLIATV